MAEGRPSAIASFWHGPLSWLERLCLTSFVAQGHVVHLYAYEPMEGLPEGVEWRDASEVVPRERLFFYKGKGTVGVFSDLFRMSILARGLGIWADADIYCLRPFTNLPDHVLGYERPGSVNGAVLHLPAGSAILEDLLSIFADGPRPLFEQHLPPFRRLEVAARRLVGIKVPPQYMQYGATGPFALTHYVRRHALSHSVQPSDVFYPVPYESIPALMQKGSAIEPAITDRTLAVHIWRSQLTRRGREEMPAPDAGSALAGLCERHGIAV